MDELLQQLRVRFAPSELLQSLAPELDDDRDSLVVGSLAEANLDVLDDAYLDTSVFHRRSLFEPVDRPGK